jgi:tetratricopeptide (TPR) repeat protein
MTATWDVVRLDAIYVRPDLEQIPVERIVENLNRMVTESPANVELVINLARVHAMAYATRKTSFDVWKKRPQDGPFAGVGQPSYYPPQISPGGSPAELKAATVHLNTAIATYERATKLAPENAIAHLGLGWTLSEAGRRAEAITALRRAVALNWPRDRDAGFLMHGERSVTQEAAAYLLRLLDPAKDRDEMADLRTKMSLIEKLPRAITPIAVPIVDDAELADLVTTEPRVLFDADGSGVFRRWTWITPKAAWLVYDQKGRGEIGSALQLFGSVTFWLFWDTGYTALRALDDNADGELHGSELRHLALWHDRDSDGISDTGEVLPLHAWNIVALSTDAEVDDEHPTYAAWSPAGARYGNGTVRPTFDLILYSVQSKR